jgi:fido (protein-threonine AMPylation protein)
MISDTELRLSFWRDGSTQAERLAGSALRLSGYDEIDPQSPLGGPDGKKDILCQKGGLTWVGAVYFPTGPTRFATIKKKYNSDLSGAPAKPQGFVFITNQTLTPSQRKTLTDLARKAGKEADILHLQQLINLLDSAPGYGARLQHLRIPMTIEEQLSWSVESDSQTAKALATNTRELLALRASIERIQTDQSQQALHASIERIQTDQSHLMRTIGLAVSGVATLDLISVSSFQKSDDFPPISAVLSPALLLLFHRLTCFDLPTRAVGQLRTNQVSIANSEGQRATHIQPPPVEEVKERLTNLCNEWNANYAELRNPNTKLNAIANFHAKFLVVHPFLDGNGRVARAILMQQCLDLFGRADMTLMNKGADYYAALRAADAGDCAALAALIDPVVHG